MNFKALIATTVGVSPRSSTIICHNSEKLGEFILAEDGVFHKLCFPECPPGIHVFEGKFTNPTTGIFRDPTPEEMQALNSGIRPWPEQSSLDTIKAILQSISFPITEKGGVALDIALNFYTREKGDADLSSIAYGILLSLPPEMVDERRSLSRIWAHSAPYHTWSLITILARDVDIATSVLWAIEDRLGLDPIENGPRKTDFLVDIVNLSREYEAKDPSTLNRAILRSLAKIRKLLEDE